MGGVCSIHHLSLKLHHLLRIILLFGCMEQVSKHGSAGELFSVCFMIYVSTVYADIKERHCWLIRDVVNEWTGLHII